MSNRIHGSNSLASTNSSRSSPHTPSRDGISSETLRPFPTPRMSSNEESPFHARSGGALTNGIHDNRNGVVVRRPLFGAHNPVQAIDLSPNQILVRHGQMITEMDHKNKEIQDLKAKLEEATFQLECEKDKASEARHQVSNLKDKTIHLEGENERLSNAKVSSAKTIADLKDKLERANTTIQVQSNQIRNPRDGRVYGPAATETYHSVHPNTPTYHHTRPQPPQSSTDMVPWRNRGRDGPRTPSYDRFPRHGPLAVRQGRSQQRHEEATLDQLTFTVQPAAKHTEAQIRHPRNQEHSFETVIHQNTPIRLGPPVNIGAILSRLFTTTMEWSRKSCNDPTAGQDQGLPREIWSDLGQDTNDPFIAGLLADPKTRYLVVTKLVLGRLVSFALFPKLIRDFKQAYDDRIENERRKVYTGVLHSIRQESVMGINQIAQDIGHDPDWEEFIGRQIASQMTDLWRIVAPLLDHSTSPDDAWAELRQIFEGGVNAGLQMLQSFSMFSVDFPHSGKKVDFNKENMSNVDPYFRQDPITLGKMGLKVRLAVAPVVNQNLLESKNSQFRPILFSKVLLKH